MNSHSADSLYICPWSLNDPLCRSQSLPYIRGLVGGGYRFAMMTFENESFATAADECEAIREGLAAEGIFWYPVRWDSGTGLRRKLGSILSAVSTGVRVILRHRPRLLHSRSSLPVPVSLILTRLFGLKFLYDADSVLSEEYMDIGYISREGKGFKLLAKSEAMARQRADHMIVLTDALRRRFADEGVKVPIDVIPCCVDTQIFAADEDARRANRLQLGLAENQKLLVYVGKPGSWYLVEETFEFFRVYKENDRSARLLIVSQAEAAVFHEIAQKMGVGTEDYFVRHASADEVPGWLSAADAGLSLIKQVGSKQGSSPIKFAEYLACGLLVITTDRIGDCSGLVRDGNIGVVLRDTDKANITEGARELSKLFLSNLDDLRDRCRRTAETKFSVESIAKPAYTRIYRKLLG